MRLRPGPRPGSDPGRGAPNSRRPSGAAGALAAALALAPALAPAASYRGYRASARDLDAFQAGISLVREVQPELFPNGVADISAVLYDGRFLHIYSASRRLPFPKVRRWRAYQVYRLRYSGAPSPSQWGGCRGGGGSFVEKNLKGRLGAYFECAPLGTFVEVQRRKKRSLYVTRDSYLATVVHEAAHQYQEVSRDHPPGFDELIPRVSALVPASSDLGARALREAYAQWCELSVSEKRFPKHHAAMLKDVTPGWEEPHNLGMLAVREEWLSRRKPAEAAPSAPQSP